MSQSIFEGKKKSEGEIKYESVAPEAVKEDFAFAGFFSLQRDWKWKLTTSLSDSKMRAITLLNFKVIQYKIINFTADQKCKQFRFWKIEIKTNKILKCLWRWWKQKLRPKLHYHLQLPLKLSTNDGLVFGCVLLKLSKILYICMGNKMHANTEWTKCKKIQQRWGDVRE